jgi:hypothetical protein
MTSVCNFLIACVAYLEEAPAICDFVVLGCDMRRLLCLCDATVINFLPILVSVRQCKAYLELSIVNVKSI